MDLSGFFKSSITDSNVQIQKLRTAVHDYEQEKWRIVAQKVGTGFTSTACKDRWTELVSLLGRTAKSERCSRVVLRWLMFHQCAHRSLDHSLFKNRTYVQDWHWSQTLDASRWFRATITRIGGFTWRHRILTSFMRPDLWYLSFPLTYHLQAQTMHA